MSNIPNHYETSDILAVLTILTGTSTSLAPVLHHVTKTFAGNRNPLRLFVGQVEFPSVRQAIPRKPSLVREDIVVWGCKAVAGKSACGLGGPAASGTTGGWASPFVAGIEPSPLPPSRRSLPSNLFSFPLLHPPGGSVRCHTLPPAGSAKSRPLSTPPPRILWGSPRRCVSLYRLPCVTHLMGFSVILS